MALYLIKRGLRPEYHKAPYHQVIICDRKEIAKWEAGCTCNAAWIWAHESRQAWTGWLLVRWKGLDLDLGHIVHACKLPDGTTSGFAHKQSEEPWSLLPGAIWWSEKKMPKWLAEIGAVYPSDDFTQQHILDKVAEISDGRRYRERMREAEPGTVVMGFSVSGVRREIPKHWPQPLAGG